MLFRYVCVNRSIWEAPLPVLPAPRIDPRVRLAVMAMFRTAEARARDVSEARRALRERFNLRRYLSRVFS